MLISRGRAFLFGALGALLVLIGAAIGIPQYSDYRARAAGGDILMQAYPVRKKVEERILALGTVEGSGTVEFKANSGSPSARIEELMVEPNGTMIIRGAPYGQVLVLIPSFKENIVSWRCLGGSGKEVPSQCRAGSK